MTDLAHKQEALVGSVGISAMAAPRASFARIVGIHLDRHAPGAQGFVGKQAMQGSKGPLRAGRIGLPLLLARSLASLPFRAFADLGQVFQPDQTMGVSAHDALGDDMIGVGFQPSLPPGNYSQATCGRTGAFLLQTLSQSGVMVGLGHKALARMETGLSSRVAGHGQVANPNIHPDDAALRIGGRVWYVYLQRDQQIELLAGLVIAEFGRANGCSMLYQGRMLAIARIGDDHPTRKRQDAHPLVCLEAVVMSQLVLKGGGDVLGSRIQPLVAFLGQSRLAQSRMLLGLGPESLVGGSDLPGNGAGHLRRDGVVGAYLAVGAVLQAHLVAHLAMLESIATHIVQRIAVNQLGLAQCLELLRRGLQFEFGGQGLLHRTSVPYFHENCKREKLMKAFPPAGGAAFLTMPEGRGISPRSGEDARKGAENHA